MLYVVYAVLLFASMTAVFQLYRAGLAAVALFVLAGFYRELRKVEMLGHKLHRNRHGSLVSRLRQEYEDHLISILWRRVYRGTGLMVLFVALVALITHTSPNPYPGPPALLIVHLSLVALWVLFGLASMFRFNGKRNPPMHKRVVNAFFIVTWSMTATGLILLYLLLQQ